MEHYLERYKDQFFNIFNIKNENYLIEKKVVHVLILEKVKIIKKKNI